MVSKIFYLLIFGFFISCNSKRELCLSKTNIIDIQLFNKYIDTNCIYIKKYKIDINDENSLFIKESNALIKETKPCIRFLRNGKFEYYNDLNSFNLRKPVYGNYKFRNDTIEVCREYYSPQSGYYFGTSIFVIKDSIIEERNFPIENGITTIYEKKCK